MIVVADFVPGENTCNFMLYHLHVSKGVVSEASFRIKFIILNIRTNNPCTIFRMKHDLNSVLRLVSLNI